MTRVRCSHVSRAKGSVLSLPGAGTLRIKEPARAANPRRGARVYGEICSPCHGPGGAGVQATNGAGYQIPPLRGTDSYNNGAGMARILTAAAYAMHNMPLGAKFDAPVLTDADAYDVAGYLESSRNRPRQPIPVGRITDPGYSSPSSRSRSLMTRQ